MSIVVARPPNFELILRAFPDAYKPGVIFAYGEDIYFPSGGVLNDPIIPLPLLKHEAVHQQRQLKMFTPDEWWEHYLADPGFRYNEELLAHVVEFKAQDYRGIDRNQRAKLLQRTAARLIAPLYNYQPPRSMNQALTDIKFELNRK